MTERDKDPSPRSDIRKASAEDPSSADAREGETGAEADPKTSEFDERRSNRRIAAAARERAAQRREAGAAERDRAQAAADERTRARRGAAGDRELAAADRDDHASERDRSQAEADRRTSDRDQAADDRQHAAADRHDDASDRDRFETEAEQRTSDRDQAAEDRHHAALDRDQTASDLDVYQAAADQRSVNRNESARDREHAAADREAAISDRAGADHDYGLRRDDLRRAQLDQLTGAFGREIGLLLLAREIDRARHGNGDLVLAYIDVDGLKQVNDSHGHGVGDALLRDVAGAIQEHLRSYDTLVRVGGDEFVCALGDCTLSIAHNRFEHIRTTMLQTQPEASISVGFAELRPHDTLQALTKRGDVALYEVKRVR